MTAVLTPERQEAIADAVTEFVGQSLREPIKEIVKEAIEEAETEQRSEAAAGSQQRGRRSAGSAALVGLGMAIGYVLRGQADGSIEETKDQLTETVQEKEDELSEAEDFEEVDIVDENDESEADEETDGSRRLLPGVLFVLATGALGYTLKSRFGSVKEAADEAVERAPQVSEAGTVTDESPETSTGGAETSERVADVGTEDDGENDETDDGSE